MALFCPDKRRPKGELQVRGALFHQLDIRHKFTDAGYPKELWGISAQIIVLPLRVELQVTTHIPVLTCVPGFQVEYGSAETSPPTRRADCSCTVAAVPFDDRLTPCSRTVMLIQSCARYVLKDHLPIPARSPSNVYRGLPVCATSAGGRFYLRR